MFPRGRTLPASWLGVWSPGWAVPTSWLVQLGWCRWWLCLVFPAWFQDVCMWVGGGGERPLAGRHV